LVPPQPVPPPPQEILCYTPPPPSQPLTIPQVPIGPILVLIGVLLLMLVLLKRYQQQ
jgi:hypothetical protein